MKTVLTVAGSDPTGGAGIQADLKTFARFGVRGLSAVTAVTAQGTRGVDGVFPLDGQVVAAQLASLTEEFGVSAVKVGMLYSSGAVVELVAWLDQWGRGPIVVDPIVLSGTGIQLIRQEALAVFRDRLLPRATLLTPNLGEASLLAGIPVGDIASMETAARRIHALGAGAVLVKGGHLDGPAADLLFDGQRSWRWEEPRTPGRIHGAGCALSSAIAAGLARGKELPDAVSEAKKYVARAIARGHRLTLDGPLFLDHSVDPG